jgi:hypothetical protein
MTVVGSPAKPGATVLVHGPRPPLDEGLQGHTQVGRVEVTGTINGRREGLQSSSGPVESVSPETLAVLDQRTERGPHRGQGHRPVDPLQGFEQPLEPAITLLDFSPPGGQRAVGPTANEIQAHLHAIEQIAAAVAEVTKSFAKQLKPPLALDEPE